jgi:DNA-binding NarL/FixJ family response regulator
VNYSAAYALISPVGTELLTVRQREVFDLIVVGQSNKEIARKLDLSEGTVKIHIAKLFDKLGVRHRSAVALAGAKLGIRPSPTVFGQDSTFPWLAVASPLGSRS